MYMYMYIYRYAYIYIRRPLFRGCHQAAKEQCSSYRTFYVMIVYFPNFIADCLVLNSIQHGKKKPNHLPLWPCRGSLDPDETMLPPARECNPAHSGVPGPVRDPGQALGISKGLQHDVQGQPSSQNGPEKACPRPSNGRQMVSN